MKRSRPRSKVRTWKSVSTPGAEIQEDPEVDHIELSESEAREYRALAARANYLALDRVDIQYAVKEICRGMASPTNKHLRMIKRLARYLGGCGRVVWHFENQGISELGTEAEEFEDMNSEEGQVDPLIICEQSLNEEEIKEEMIDEEFHNFDLDPSPDLKIDLDPPFLQ